MNKRHRTLVEWTCFSIDEVRRWYPDRDIVLVGDGSCAAVPLIQRCQRFKIPVKLVSRLRLDAVLHDPPGPQPKSKPGPKPQKGARQPSLADRLEDPKTVWQTLTVPCWYGGKSKEIEIVTGVSLWYRRGLAPVPIRWVLVRCPDSSFRPTALFCSDQMVSAEQIIAWFIARWNIEVTFEEVRAHLGFGTQRHWSDRAVERTTPCLLGSFSLVVVMAQTLHSTAFQNGQSRVYISQLYIPRRRARTLVVFLKSGVWEEIDGETVAVVLEQAAEIFPAAARVTHRGVELIAMDYEVWKEKVLIKQQDATDGDD